ncbi:ATP-dependent RNA helicase [Starmerella bacillaris]|uniref:RNA helicase n=1 Tax=Starmerella bacillaris TaxID=1247836 RepID=A0AAV5REJ8_STABA|nr:ATP-dependent RNA helicase [Starmerella bacillaris]
MAKYKQGFNSKARQGSVDKQLKYKQKAQKIYQERNSSENASPEDRELELQKMLRRHELARPESDARKRVRLAMQFPEHANQAKKKRLEKYIERQVRKEEKDILLEKLASKKIDSSKLTSLANLGYKVGGKKKERLDDLESGSDQDSDDSELESDSDSQIESGDDTKTNGSGAETNKNLNNSSAILANFGSSFSNLPVKQKNKVEKGEKMSWRKRLGIELDEIAKEDDESDSSEISDSEESDSNESDDEGSITEESNGNDTNAVDNNSDKGTLELNKKASEQSDTESPGETSSEEDSQDSDDETGEYFNNNEKSAGTEFAEWAQTHEVAPVVIPKVENYVHKPREEEPQPQADSTKEGYHERTEMEPVLVTRTEEIEEIRSKLPAVAAEQRIMEIIHHFDVCVVTGETGSGKTTQVPQFLFEAGYCNNKQMIGITQPRRVAAVSMAQRIGEELNGFAKVGYQIRFDRKVDNSTQIKLMTDGVLIREMSTDLLLTKYSCLIIDEAHERSVNTDILIGLLSRIVIYRRQQNNPLKLIIMSATLRVTDFVDNSKLFRITPQVINIDSRQFTVTNHFSRRTNPDYVDEAITKVKRIHNRLPDGGILVFLTGKEEIERVVEALSEPNTRRTTPAVQFSSKNSCLEDEFMDANVDEEVVNDLDDFKSDEQEDDIEEGVDMTQERSSKKLKVLPLYSLLSTEDQMRVFEKCPKNTRLCVVATNVAETSLTIPNIKYVVDCGRSKQKVFENGVQRFSIKYTSKASADQRSGRAGRTGPGHCYRLYSSAVFERDFPQFMDPEILRMPVEGLVLQMKAMGIDKIDNFPFPTEIPNSSLKDAIRTLQCLLALDSEGKITELGNQMSLFPLAPRHAKMLLIGNQNKCLNLIIGLVSAMSVPNLFNYPSSTSDPDNVKEDEDKKESKLPVIQAQADVLQSLAAIAAYSWTPTSDICVSLSLRYKAMRETEELRKQLCRLVAQILAPDGVSTLQKQLSEPLNIPTPTQISTLMQVVAAAYIDQVAIRQHLVHPSEETQKLSVRQVSRTPYETCSGQVVYIHPSTIMKQAPDLIVYESLLVSSTDKVRMRPLTVVSLSQLSLLAKSTPLLTYSKPLGGVYKAKVYEKRGETYQESWVVPRFGFSQWDLPPRKIKQVRRQGRWINLE